MRISWHLPRLPDSSPFLIRIYPTYNATNEHCDIQECNVTRNRHGDIPEINTARNQHGDIQEINTARNQHGDIQEINTARNQHGDIQEINTARNQHGDIQEINAARNRPYYIMYIFIQSMMMPHVVTYYSTIVLVEWYSIMSCDMHYAEYYAHAACIKFKNISRFYYYLFKGWFPYIIIYLC